jgi:FtsH-binding integral membrane protein
MSWHVDEMLVGRYQTGTLDRVAAASVESHVTACDVCRELFAVDAARFDRSWAQIVDRVEPGRHSLIERALTAVGVPGHVARLVAVSPALRMSFVLAVMLVVGFAVAAAGSNPEGRSFRWFLLVAPLVPVAGVAFAYGRLVDPAYELTMAAPLDSFRLVLLRTATVLAVTLPVGLVAWPIVPSPATLGVSAWLIPALSLTTATLGLASRLEPWVAGSVTSVAWFGLWLAASAGDLEPYGAAVQAVLVVVAVVAGATMTLRRDRYDQDWSRR